MPSSNAGATAFDPEQAARDGDIDLLRSILDELPFGPETEEVYKRKQQALLYAANKGHADCLQLLLAHGADTRFDYRDGNTALHLAAGNGHKDCLQLLLERLSNAHQLEALIDKRNYRRMTALHK
ncbi:hypothetical protein ABPG77_003028 [Micractinium sp. CCAP 211/92]